MSISSLTFIEYLFRFSIHLKQEEKLSVRCGRDGGVESLEVHGMIMLRVKSEEYGRIVVVTNNKESRNIQLQVKEYFPIRGERRVLFFL